MSHDDDTQNERSLEPVKNAVLGIETVDGRRLHAFLQVGKDFSNWIKDRVAAYGFEEGRDYATDLLANFGEKGQGRPTKEYALSLDMAKELSMVERNEKGKQARRYFIECERRAKAATDPMAVATALNDPAALRTLLLENVEERLKLVAKIEHDAPKLDAFDRIAGADGSLCITDAAKSLQVKPKSLFEFLRSHGWVYSPPGGRGDIAYSTTLQRGLMEHKTTTVHRSDGSEKIITQARITPKGLARLASEFPPPALAA